MAEVIVPLLELSVIEKTPPGKLLSKADFISCAFFMGMSMAISLVFGVRITAYCA